MKKTDHKKMRQAAAAKKRKQKKILIATICVVLAAAIVVLLISLSMIRQRSERVFTDGRQTITLRDDGTFAARLYHNVRANGTYTEMTEGNATIITFVSGGTSIETRVVNNVLTVPAEWTDAHGHNRRLTLR